MVEHCGEQCRHPRVAGVAAALALALSLAVHAAPATAQSATRTQQFELAAQPLGRALNQLAVQADRQILVAPDLVRGLQAPRMAGHYTFEEALGELLKRSGLGYVTRDDGVVIITRAHTGSTDQAPRSPGPAVRRAAEPQEQEFVELQSVVVTGSYIRGDQNQSTPLIVIDREQIDRSGHSTVADVIASLPQNVATVSDRQGTLNASNENNFIVNGFGAAANLRGLGVDSTLVLVNGRRAARSGNDSFVDLTLIPLAAIERVEVLTDGASALYGADAVGGVINMITRRGFDGAETRLRYGGAAGDGRDERQFTQVFGHAWASGQLFASYTNQRVTPLKAVDRFSGIDPNYSSILLFPGHDTQGATFSLEQDLSPRLSSYLDIGHGRRESSASSSNVWYGINKYDADSRNLSIGSGIRYGFGEDWQLRVDGSRDRQRLALTGWMGPTPETLDHNYGNILTNTVKSLDVVADGSLMHAPGGPVRLAVGASGRWESLDRLYHNSDDTTDHYVTGRNAKAAYAELIVPFFGPDNRRPGLERLQFSLAARSERYSDFGSSFDPKLGLAWSPVNVLTLRASAGTSFKAPTLSQTSHGLQTYSYLDYYVDEAGPTNVMILLGSTAELQPEEARNWSLGFDYAPRGPKGLQLSATLFDIDYSNRIGDPFPSGYSSTHVILDPVYAFLVQRDPSLEDLASYREEATFNGCYDMVNYVECDPAAVAAGIGYVIDTRTRNLAKVRQRGVDLVVSHAWETDAGRWNLRAAGMKTLRSTRQFAPGGEPLEQVNQVGYPVDLRLRSSLTFSSQHWSVTATGSYTGHYRDTYSRWTGDQERKDRVASFTTVDLSLQRAIGTVLGFSSPQAVQVGLHASNILDRRAPYVAHHIGLNYDAVNADPLGRFVSADVRMSW